MSILDAPASIKATPGLANILQNNKNYQLIADCRVDPANSAVGASTTTGVFMTRLSVIPAVSCQKVILVYANWNAGNSLAENPGFSNVKVHSGLENLAGLRYNGTFGGKKFGDNLPDSLLYSDPVAFTAVAGTQFFVRTSFTVPGTGYTIPTGAHLMGGTLAGAVNNGDGTATIDNVETGLTSAIRGAGCGPVAILGYVPTPIKSACGFGDSINVGQADGGYAQNAGGYVRRAFAGQLNLKYTFPITPVVPYTMCGRVGDTLSAILNPVTTAAGSGAQKRIELAMLASTIVSELGTNDLTAGATLATMKSNYLLFANIFLTAGKYYVACTLTPRATSTDGFKTTANQTKPGFESIRTAFNDWLRDTTATGFAQQSVAPSHAQVFDAAAVVEVNPSNVLTTNGGYWKIAPSGGTPAQSGTLTAGGPTALSDTTQTVTQDQYKGYIIRMTSGAAANVGTTIYSNFNTGTFNCYSTFSPAPTTGDAYEIYQAYTVDGTHPSSLGHQTIAISFPITLIK